MHIKHDHSIVHVCLNNRGVSVNGLNISGWSGYAVESPQPSIYNVNGLDLSLMCDESTVNGMAITALWITLKHGNGVFFSPFGSDIDHMNGIVVSGLVSFADYTMNGIAISGLCHIGSIGNGIALSGIANTYDSTFNGLMMSGIFNHQYNEMRRSCFVG